MKKGMVCFLSALLLWTLTACAREGTIQDASGNAEASSSSPAGQGDQESAASDLTALITRNGRFYRYCSTEEGFYYMTEEAAKLSDGGSGYHLMYMDYATCQEVYLCSDSSCQHDTEDCTAVFSAETYSYDGRIFLWDGYLYYLDRPLDNSGIRLYGDIEVFDLEADQAALYRMNLDGSERKLIYTFDADATVEDLAFGNDEGLYFVTKTLSTTKNASGIYFTTANRQLIRLNLNSGKAEPVCSLDFGDGLNWQVIGCAGDKLVLKVYQYPDGITGQDDIALDDIDCRRYILDRTDIVYATLALSTGEKTQIYSQNSDATSDLVLNGCLYTSNSDSEDIVRVDTETGETSVLTSLSHKYLYTSLGNLLLCTDIDATDYDYYIVDTETGETAHTSLTNQSLGWPLNLVATTGSQVLVIYDYEYIDHGDDSYEITRYQYGLIEWEDLLNNTAHYTPIQMVGKGM